MFTPPHFRLFALAVLMINITPGATFVAVSSESVRKGLKGGLFTAAGACVGLLVYALLTWVGLSVIITANPIVFTIIKYTGICYLLYCGIKAIFQKPFDIKVKETARLGESFKKGLLVNLLNPLTPVLFPTLIPQFISYPQSGYSGQLIFLGLWICFSAFTVNIIWAFLFSYSGKYLATKPGFWKWQGLITGVLFLYLAIRFSLLK